jgi:hypothetical protein
VVRCGVCGIDPDITTSRRCMCPVTLVLCTCGKWVVHGEAHEHIENAVGTTARYFENAVSTGR